MTRTLTFEEALQACKGEFTRLHPSWTMEWGEAKYGEYVVGVYTSHFTDKPNVTFRKLFHNLKEVIAFNNLCDFGDGVETWHI